MPSKGLLTGFRAFVKRLEGLIEGLFRGLEMEHKCEQNLVKHGTRFVHIPGNAITHIEDERVERCTDQHVVKAELEKRSHKI